MYHQFQPLDYVPCLLFAADIRIFLWIFTTFYSEGKTLRLPVDLRSVV